MSGAEGPGGSAGPTGSEGSATRLARGSLQSLVGSLGGALLGIGVTVAVTRGFSTNDAGVLFAATSLFLIGVAGVQLGAETGIVRFLPVHLVAGRSHAVRPTLRTALVPVLVVGVLAAAVLVVLAPALDPLLGVSEQQAATATGALQVLALTLPLAAALEVVLAGTRGYGDMRPTVLTDRFGRQLLQVLFVVAAALTGLGLGGLTVAWAAPYAFALAAATVLLVRRLPARGADAPPPPGLAREFWAFTAPRALARLAQVTLQRIDIIIVAALRSPPEAALFAAASRLLVFGLLGVQAVQQILQPELSRLLAEGDRRSTVATFRTATIWTVLLTWPVYLAIAVAAPVVLEVFGPGYSDAATAATLLSVSMLAASAAGSVDVALLMAGRSVLSLANTIAALVVNLGLAFWLVPDYGITGAAIAWTASILVRNALPVVQVRRLLGITAASKGLAVAAVSATVCFGAIPLAVRLVVGDSLVPLVAALVVGTAIYLAVGWWRRESLGLTIFATFLRRSRR